MKALLNRARFANRSKLALLMASAAFSSTFAATAQAQQFYKLESAVTMKSSGPDWDYITFEPARSYLYIARRHEGATVYDTKAKKVVGTIENSQDANATALVQEFDRGFTINEDGTVTLFQLSTLKPISRIKLGKAADTGIYEPVTKQVAVMLGDEKQIVFLDPKTGSLLHKLQMDSVKLEAPTPDGEGNLFIGQRDKNSVARVDAKQHKVTAEWKIEGCEQPSGLAVDRANKRIFVGCRGKNPVLAVMDSESGKVVATPEIGRGNDGVVYDPEAHKVYASNGVDANLVIYDQIGPDTYKLSQATTTRPYARTMALDPKTKSVYLVTAEGTFDPAEKSGGPASFYPNKYFPDTFTVLTYSAK